MESQQSGVMKIPTATVAPIQKHTIRIGRPGYKVHPPSLSLSYFHFPCQVTKSRDLATRQRSLTFEIDYPEAENGLQPRHRFMSAYEQKVESPDKNYQYLLFACDPYETVAFKVYDLPPSPDCL